MVQHLQLLIEKEKNEGTLERLPLTVGINRHIVVEKRKVAAGTPLLSSEEPVKTSCHEKNISPVERDRILSCKTGCLF
ncbi:MAG: hypothetical protein KQH63_17680 [Desulfobulbaceae bacterium]|nr:hypothetical protein [Desulfobulbaceae bacterium]